MVYADFYRVGAHAVIIDGEGRVLTLRATYNDGFWGLPGGSVDVGETPDETVRRECLEELGCSVKDARLTGVYYHEKHNCFSFIFRCKLWPDAVITLSQEHSEYRYASASELSVVQQQRIGDCLGFKGRVTMRSFMLDE